MIHYKSAEEIEFIRESSLLVSKTLATVALEIKPGITTKRLDEIAEAFILDNHAVPAFKGYNGFKGSVCISVNEEVVHGVPGNRILKDGDIISVDCGVLKNGFFGDSAYTFMVGEVSNQTAKLLEVTKNSLSLAIEQVKPGNRLGDVSFAVQEYCEKQHQYGVVRELVGHGIGENLHEKPEVPNYGRKGKGIKIKEGLVIAIEPMVNLGTKDVIQLEDGWTIVSKDRSVSAHFEHTVAVTKQGVDVLSTFEYIEEAVKHNKEIKELI